MWCLCPIPAPVADMMNLWPRKWLLQATNRGPQVTQWVGTEVGVVALRSLDPQAQCQLFHKGKALYTAPHDLHSVDDPGGEQVWDHLSSRGPSGSAKVSAILNHPLNKPQLLPCPPGLWPPLTSPSIPLPPTRHGLVISTSYLFCHLCRLALTRRTQISPVGAWIPPKGFVFT